MYSLLQKDERRLWGSDQKAAFEKAKCQLTSESLLVHYDTSKELLLSCDTSPYGIEAVLSYKMPDGKKQPIAVLSYKMPDGKEQPIAFSSRSLSKA